MYEHKGVQKAIKSWVGKHDDLNMSVVLDDDEIVLTAQCDVSGLNQGKLFNRLKALFIASHGVIWWTEVAEKEVEEEFIKNLQKMKLEYMSPIAFKEFTSVHKSVEREGVTQGAWDMSSPTSGITETYLNYGDRVVFESVLPFAMLTDEQRASLVPGIEKWVKKNKLKKAETSVNLVGENPNRVVVTATVYMDGKLKGKDFAKILEKYSIDWLIDMWEAYSSYRYFVAEYAEEVPDRLDNRLLFLSLGDDFSNSERQAPAVPRVTGSTFSTRPATRSPSDK